jgi:hypothetical protein
MQNFTKLSEAFPSYDISTLPIIPDNWEDVSYVNDACPSFEVGPGIMVYVDFADPADRELDGVERFAVAVNCYDEPEFVLQTDDWSEVILKVAELMSFVSDYADRQGVTISYLERAHREDGLLIPYDTSDYFIPLETDMHRAPIRNVYQAMKYIQFLIKTDQMFHFEDSPESIVSIATGEPSFPEFLWEDISNRVRDMYALDWSIMGTECPIGGYFLLGPLPFHYEEQEGGWAWRFT